jgi:hypothetical protein
MPERGRASVVVLVTLNWSSGFSELLKHVIAASPSDWAWWIRLHPLMAGDLSAVRSWCETNAGERARVDEPTELPLPLLLEAADVHVTHNSSVVQEASQLGTLSIVIDRRALDVYADELRSGWAVFADEPRAILAAILELHHRRGASPAPKAYPSWTQMARAVHDLIAENRSCSSTAAAASSPTPARA